MCLAISLRIRSISTTSYPPEMDLKEGCASIEDSEITCDGLDDFSLTGILDTELRLTRLNRYANMSFFVTRPSEPVPEICSNSSIPTSSAIAILLTKGE